MPAKYAENQDFGKPTKEAVNVKANDKMYCKSHEPKA